MLIPVYDPEIRRSRCADCARPLAHGQAECICDGSGSLEGVGCCGPSGCCGDPGDCDNANGGGC